MDACAASSAYAAQQPAGGVRFVGPEGGAVPAGKRMSNGATRVALGWYPRHPSFIEFVAREGARDWYTQSELAPAGMPHA